MAGQSVIPRTGEQQKDKNLLEGFGRVMRNDLFNQRGHSLAIIGLMKLPLGEPPSDKVVGARRLSKPIVKILAGAINILSTPMPSLDSTAVIGTHKIQIV
ncbi:hypothetical protein X943_000030 [Babesia divergens]|uniref:Uncharacterized protein n=1 Tax=Babesia divergens TaxID=32595 RepID=A0AAD9GE62_BABDI|nr:hypothetical protein X943_000030 [Babesia divergens]